MASMCGWRFCKLADQPEHTQQPRFGFRAFSLRISQSKGFGPKLLHETFSTIKLFIKSISVSDSERWSSSPLLSEKSQQELNFSTLHCQSLWPISEPWSWTVRRQSIPSISFECDAFRDLVSHPRVATRLSIVCIFSFQVESFNFSLVFHNLLNRKSLNGFWNDRNALEKKQIKRPG